MKCGELYFRDVPKVGDLRLESSLYKFDTGNGSKDVVFICVDDKLNEYLCIVTDILYNYDCLIMKISSKDIKRLLSRKLALYRIIDRCEEIIECTGDERKFELRKRRDFNEGELPRRWAVIPNSLNVLKHYYMDRARLKNKV